MIKIIPATSEIVRYFYSDTTPLPTIRGALAVMEDGEPIAIAGLYRKGRYMVLFSDAAPEVRQRLPLTSYRVAKKLLEYADRKGWSVIAIPKPDIEPANRFLLRFGFEETEQGFMRRAGQ